MATQVATKTEFKLKMPDSYRLVFLDDDTTAMEFVIDVLMTIIDMDEDEAFETMMEIHESGSAIVTHGLSKEKANSMMERCIDSARKQGFNDFKVLVEKELS